MYSSVTLVFTKKFHLFFHRHFHKKMPAHKTLSKMLVMAIRVRSLLLEARTMSIKSKLVSVLCLALLLIAAGISLAVDRARELDAERFTPANTESKPMADNTSIQAIQMTPSANTKPDVNTSKKVTLKHKEQEELFIDP